VNHEIEDQADHLAELSKRLDSNVAAYPLDSAGRHGSEVLALRCRGLFEPVRRVRIDTDFGAELPDPQGQRYDVSDAGTGVKDALGRHYDRWMPEPGRTSGWQPQIQQDDITQVQQQASRLRQA
jgi:hypothetical protein